MKGSTPGICPCGKAFVGQRNKVYCTHECGDRHSEAKRRGYIWRPDRRCGFCGVKKQRVSRHERYCWRNPAAGVLERILAKTIVQPNGCIEWTGMVDLHGYGWTTYSGEDGPKRTFTHRVVYLLSGRTIPDGLELDHLCRNPPCLNLDHLEAVTHKENVRRGEGGQHQRAKTHCPAGHPYNEKNTYRDRDGHRHCRPCVAVNLKRFYAKRRLVQT